MPVPSNISDLSPDPGDNYPKGSESPSLLDDYQRAHAAFIAQLDAADDAHIANPNAHPQYAPLASPALTGTPTAPTATAGTNTTQLATTEFVQSEKPPQATQAEMEAGTELAVRSMSPLGVAQAIAAQVPPPANHYVGGRGQVFTATGNFTVPDGITAIKVRGCAGGGGGTSGGSNGGTTSFGSYCSATGGRGSPNGGAGGVATGGDINLNGGDRTSSSAGLCGGSGMFGGAVVPAPSTGYGNGGFYSTSSHGGGGGYFEKYITGLTPGDVITVTIPLLALVSLTMGCATSTRPSVVYQPPAPPADLAAPCPDLPQIADGKAVTVAAWIVDAAG